MQKKGWECEEKKQHPKNGSSTTEFTEVITLCHVFYLIIKGFSMRSLCLTFYRIIYFTELAVYASA